MLQRIFTAEDQEEFAELSGDFNPMHVDAVAARRFMFGKPVVHGIHLLMWAIDELIKSNTGQTSVRIKKLSVTFRSPVIVGEHAVLKINPARNSQWRIDISANSVRKTTINIAFSEDLSVHDSKAADVIPFRQACVERSRHEITGISGTLPLCLARSVARKMFPFAGNRLDGDQFAMLLASTRLVGMELPGLHSLFTGLELVESLAEESAPTEFAFNAESFDDRFSLVSVRVSGGGLGGTISAASRPPPQKQVDFASLCKVISPNEFGDIRALVIGGSRGLGEIVVKALAAGGAEVRFTYHRGAMDAQTIADEITQGGGKVNCFAYDVTGDPVLLAQHLGEWSPTLLCYFATPFISPTPASGFSANLFQVFCDVYVVGFDRVLTVFAKGPIEVINPSSVYVEQLPTNMLEYTAAKAAAETLCKSMAKSRPESSFSCPRLPRLPTDQTASLLAVEAEDPVPIILNMLRSRF